MNGFEFHLIRPAWLLALLPLAAVLWGMARHPASESAWRQACDAHLLSHLLAGTGSNKRARLLAVALGWLVATLALAGPTWSKIDQPVFQSRDARVIVLDLSLSMDATDVKPSRLVRARFKVLDLLARSRDGQTGLVVYAHDAYALSPLTDDADTLAAMVPVLSTDLMPGQGSDLERGLLLADDLLHRSKTPSGEVIVVTDGVSALERATAAAEQLRRRGRIVSVLGVGTSDGAPVPLARGGFLKDADGSIVVPRLDASKLETVARAGGGIFVASVADDEDVAALIRRGASLGVDQTEQTTLAADQWREDGIWLVVALLPFGALAFRRGWILGCLVLTLGMPEPTLALDWADLWQRSDQQGANAMSRGEAASAAELFRNPAWRGTAWYRAGEYQRAAESYLEVATPDAHYNRANALAKLGDLGSAIEAYDAALALEPDHADALHNKALLEQLLEQFENDERGQSTRPQGQSGTQDGDKMSPDDQTGSQSSEPEPGEEDGRREEEDQLIEESDADYDDGQQDRPEENESGATGSAQTSTQGSDDEDKPDESDAEEQRPPEQGASASADAQRPRSEMSEEAAQSLENWLRRIPDDPGGLLRRKFEREYRRRLVMGQHEDSETPW